MEILLYFGMFCQKKKYWKKIENKYQDGYGDSQFNLNTITSTKQGNALL